MPNRTEKILRHIPASGLIFVVLVCCFLLFIAPHLPILMPSIPETNDQQQYWEDNEARLKQLACEVDGLVLPDPHMNIQPDTSVAPLPHDNVVDPNNVTTYIVAKEWGPEKSSVNNCLVYEASTGD